MPKVIVATSVGKLDDGSHLVLFPSRCTCNTGKSKPFSYFPYELAYLTALLKRDTDHKVKMIDGNLCQLNAAEYIEVLSLEAPDWLIMEVAAIDYPTSLRIATELKRRFGTKVIFTGAYATARPKEVAKEVDYVCLGEYEYSVLDILRGNPKVEGVYPSGMREPLNVNSLPWPEDDDICRMDYNECSCDYPLAQIYASRGCMLKCSFCVAGNLYYKLPNWRPRDVANVVDEIEFLRNKYGDRMQGAFFNEEMHNGSKQFIIDLCNEIIRRGLNKLHYDAMCGYWMFDQEMLETMKKAGYYQLRFGIETISERGIKAIKSKPVHFEKLENILNIASDLGMKMYGTAMVGTFESSLEEDLKTNDYMLDLVERGLLHRRQVSVCIPQPGTPFYNWCKEKGYIFTDDLSRYDYVQPVMSYPHYKANEISYAFHIFLSGKRGSRLNYLIWSFRRRFDIVGIANIIKSKILTYKRKIVEDWREYKLRRGRWFMENPTFIQVETTNRCDLDCTMCDKESKGRHKKDMGVDNFRRLIENFPHLQLISLHGIGEPLLDEHIFDIIKICKGKGIETVFNTNGMLINKKVHQIIESGLDRLQISLDAATKKTYEEIRKGSNFEQVIDNIRLLIKTKTELQVQHPVLSVHCTVQAENIRELPKLVELCSKIGIKAITTEGAHNWTKYGKYVEQSIFSKTKSDIDVICKRALLKAKQLGINLSLFPIDRIGKTGRLSDYRCDWPWKSCYITVDGYVNPCCVSANPNVLNFGNIFHDGFQKIWNSKAYRSFRNSFFHSPRFDICRNCHYLLNYGRRIK